jgi:hypothetical protein
LALLAGVAGLAPGAASAATVWEWNFASDDGCGSSGQPSCVSDSTSWGNQRTWTGTGAGAPSVTGTAYSNTGSYSGTTSPAPTNQGTLETAYLAWFGSPAGVGVQNRDGSSSDAVEPNAPEHAMDNNQRYDSILLNFGKKVQLTNVNIGWTHFASSDPNKSENDADISLFAYIGPGTPTTAGKTYADLMALGSGWVKTDLEATGAGWKTLNSASDAQYFLIAAYVPNSAMESCSKASGIDPCDDYIKLAGLKGVERKVSEPGILGLLGLMLAGIALNRRRRGVAS